LCESAAAPRRTLQFNRSAQQLSETAADGKPETSAAVFAAGGTHGLLEGFKDDELFLNRNADTGVADGKANHHLTLVEVGIRLPPACGPEKLETYTAFLREFECIRQQILQNLVESLNVGVNGRG